MYPRTYFESFMRYEAQDQVFVAMPFSTPFKSVYEAIIEPAIRAVTVSDRPLVPRIINRATSGSPDIHEQIFDAILHSRLVIADMTVQSSFIGEDGKPRWQANANVAYEVGLATAWRNPEDILLIHQAGADHSYSFDVQHLRHVEYDPGSRTSVKVLAEEIVRALNQSRFLGRKAYQKLLESVSPAAIKYMHMESGRAFAVLVFVDTNFGIVDMRVQATTELLAAGALKNRNVFPNQPGGGVGILYEWTPLGVRMLESLRAINADRAKEILDQIASVPPGAIPPEHLRELPSSQPAPSAIDMVKAAKPESGGEASEA